jgi:hypothetical protein
LLKAAKLKIDGLSINGPNFGYQIADICRW